MNDGTKISGTCNILITAILKPDNIHYETGQKTKSMSSFNIQESPPLNGLFKGRRLAGFYS